MSLQRGWGLATLATLFLATSAVQADFVVDDFSTSTDVTVKGAGPNPKSNSEATTGPTTSIVGGDRYLTVTRTSNNTASIEGVAQDLDPGRFDFLTSSTAVGNAVLKYDGTTGPALNATGLGGQDVTQGGVNTTFRVTGFSDLGVGVTLTIYTDATHYSTGYVFVPGTGFAGVDGAYDIQLVTLVPGAGAAGAADVTNVGAIIVKVDNSVAGTGQGADANIDAVFFGKAIPEPASFALVGLGMLTSGFIAYRRRKMAK